MRVSKWFVFIPVLLFAGYTLAQPPPPPPPGPEGGPMREKARERIQTMKIWKLTEEVGLTPKQSERFFPLYNKHQKALEDIEAKRADLIDRLDKLVNDSTSSDKNLQEVMASLKDIPRQISEENDRFIKDVSPILTSRQQAKLVVFEERFRQRLQDFIRDIRRQYRGGRLDDVR